MRQAVAAPAVQRPFLSASGRAWRVLVRDRFALGGGLGVLLFVILALFAPVIAPHHPNYQHPQGLSAVGAPVAPGAEFIFGTDLLGRDLLSRVIWGTRVSLAVGVVSTIIA